MVAFPKAGEVCARRHVGVDVGGGDSAAGPRDGGRPPRPPHHLATAAGRATRLLRTARTRPARQAAPAPRGPTRRSRRETQHALRASPRLR